MKNNLLKDTGSNGFLNLPNHRDFKRSKAVIVPFGLEKSVTYGGGTNEGPEAIIHASHEVELFDESFSTEPYKRYGITTLATFQIPNSHSQALTLLSNLTETLLRQQKFPVILGGEHSLTGGSVSGVAKVLGKRGFNILHFDAHSDLRPKYQGNKFSHASALHLTIPYFHRLAQLGIRNMSSEEQPVIRRLTKAKRLKIFTAEEILRSKTTSYLTETTTFLKDKPVWLTFDVDVFDPAVIGSSTGTPEPGGLYWYGILDALQVATQKLNIIGAEFVELLPKEGQHAPDFAIAKLIYKFLNFRFAR